MELAPCPSVLDPAAPAAMVWERSPGWEVMGQGKMREPSWARGATRCCSACPGSARLDGVALGEVSWQGSVLRAPGREGDDTFPSGALSYAQMEARPGK